MKEQLILTFANQLGSPGQSLLRLDLHGYGAAWVDLESVRAAVGTHFNGLCGAVAWGNRLAVCTQSIPAFLAIFDTPSWTPVAIEPLEGVSDPHGLVFEGNRFFLASTGTNQVFAVDIQGDRVERLEAIWSYPDTEPSRDMVHLNGLTLCEGQLLATAFGPRDGFGTWGASKGRLFSVSTEEVIDEGLVHPHTPIFHRGRLYVCESSTGRLIQYGRGPGGGWVRESVIVVGGYVRGLWPEGEELLVAISGQRQVSRSRRVRVQDGETGGSKVVRLDPGNGRLELVADLAPFGREVYELVAISGGVESPGIEAAVIQRLKSLHQSVEGLTDYATRVNRELELLRADAEEPLVSIVTPAYNRADFLAETIDSVLGQDYPRIELIVLDDGSKDDTPAVLAGYGGRLMAVHHDNMGENRTVNRGLELARGEIICVVNSDDPLIPGAVSAAVDYLRERPEVLAAYPDWVEIDAEGKTLATFELPDYDISSMLLTFNVGMGPGVFIRRRALELIGMRDASLRYTGDLDYWFRLALRGPLGHIPKVLATHRTHEGAASSAAKGRIMAREVYDLLERTLASPYLPEDMRGHRHRIHSLAHSVAVAYCGRSLSAKWKHRLLGLSHALRSGDPQAWSCWAPHTLRRAKAMAGGANRRLIRLLAHSLGKSAAPVRPRLELAAARNAPGAAQFLGTLARGVWRGRHALSKTPEPARDLRFAFVSHVLPPMWSGQAMVIGRLLEHLPANAYRLISQRGAHGAGSETDHPPRVLLPAESGDQLWLRGGALGLASVLQRVVVRGWRIAREIRASGCNVAVAGTGDLIDLPATAFACALTKVPLVTYLFDDYLNQWGFAPGVQRWARVMERVFIAKSSAVIVPNEALQAELRARHGVEPALVRNPAVSLAPGRSRAPRGEGEDPRIVYTGAIYHVNYAAFRTLIAALKRLPGRAIGLDIYSAQDPAHLTQEGLKGPGVRLHAHVEPQEAAHIQRAADILFMGFSFDSEVPVVVRTSAPGKLGDYLASGRPILALVPPDSFLARYFAEHGCALVVERDDPDLLAAAIERLLAESGLAESLVNRALDRARAEFAPEVAARHFAQILEGVRDGGAR